MKRYSVVITKSVQKQLKKLPAKVADLLEKSMLTLEDNPRPYGSKKLKDRGEAYRIREGDYRIVYEINDFKLIVKVLKAGHRKDIYQ